jgi:type IX secretion system PorP/SprF family membrane protein
MKRKIAIYFTTLFLLVLTAKAQQVPLFSQYMINQYVYNPAAGGVSDTYELRSSFRQQWAGISDAPLTYYFSAHAPIGKHFGPSLGRHKNESYSHHSIGMLAYQDRFGPQSITSAYFSYSYNMFLTEELRAAVGAFGGIKQFLLDGSKIETAPGVRPYGSQSAIAPDANLGIWLYTDNFYLGASCAQIFANTINITNSAANKLTRHFFFTTGYKFHLNHDIDFIPSLYVRYVSPVSPAIDLNAKVKIKDIFWTALSFRVSNAVVPMLGFNLKQGFSFSYSYDVTVSAISNATKVGATHEVVLGYNIKPKNTVKNPSDYW